MDSAWTDGLRAELLANGATLVGFADLRGVEGAPMPYGVSILMAMDKQVMRAIEQGPTREYFDLYHRANDKLDALAETCAQRLREAGHQALAQTVAAVAEDDAYRTPLPHKTVATRAGLGWIGKCALLVTPEYGSCVRLTSVATDAPLPCGTPIDESRCGECMACRDACPARAISGKRWRVGMEREEFFDCLACRATARALAAEKLHEAVTLCGRCVVACPYARKYIGA